MPRRSEVGRREVPREGEAVTTGYHNVHEEYHRGAPADEPQALPIPTRLPEVPLDELDDGVVLRELLGEVRKMRKALDEIADNQT